MPPSELPGDVPWDEVVRAYNARQAELARVLHAVGIRYRPVRMTIKRAQSEFRGGMAKLRDELEAAGVDGTVVAAWLALREPRVTENNAVRAAIVEYEGRIVEDAS